MLKPKQMCRAIIVGHKDIMEATVEALHGSNLFHLENYNEDGSGLKLGRPFKNAGDVSKKLIQLRSISSFLGIKNEIIPKQKDTTISNELDSMLDQLDIEVTVKTEKRSELDSRLKELEALKKDLTPFMAIPIDMELYRNYESIKVFAGSVKENVGSAISQVTSTYEMEYDQNTGTLVLFIKKDDEANISEILSNFEFRELRIPEISGTPSTLIADIAKEEEGIKQQMVLLETDIISIKEKYFEFILASEELLTIEAEKAEAPVKIATSEHTFIIDGWIPDDQFPILEKTIESATSGRAFVSKQEIENADTDIIPIKYDNPKVSQPFQEIMDLYARPKYKEIDPTSLIFISFPLFYGMILGDIGYAAILLALAFGIKKMVKSDAIKPLMNVLIYCQISTLIFGVLYGEFLGFSLASLHTDHGVVPGLIAGFETITLFNSPLGGEVITYPIHRTHIVMTMIAATALIGLLHINFGYVLGFINENRKHGFATAMFEKGSWFVVELGLILGVLGYTGIAPTEIVGTIVFLMGFVMLVKGEGVKGPIELPSLLSNALSYTRLIAVGLSSIYIASTVNLIAFDMILPQGGILAVIGAIIVFIFGHALNTVLSIIAPGLHALRLQYVEFFGKFYEGGGRKYNPFGYIRKYTEE
ncbi:V-type ATP synthase subunit I [Methanococcoides burtonii]|uniref:A-type ATP synthase subunit I n=1 Tax=Methanococcoides burtonii (strain DSM 6242 / NBRC 107633 / OCM 468 / ACE-M) TaxID=259564 RepID=Q12WL6_METBU|nr:V-type ATP synthase subunit I [Methanococcoides burtonii]ABE52160.1 V-type ATPase subunit family/V-type ATP synthase subunit I-like protein [Methanococcoides burtonii DSM 6242]